MLWIYSGVFAFLGLFFPVFYLQLDAIKHGVDKDFSFYAVSSSLQVKSNTRV